MGQYRGASNIDTQSVEYGVWSIFSDYYSCVIRLSIQTVVTHPGSYIIVRPPSRDTTIRTDSFDFRFGFSPVENIRFQLELVLSSTLNFWIEYLCCNDDLVSKISDHFPNVNYLKSPNSWNSGLDFNIGPCRRSYYAPCIIICSKLRPCGWLF